MTAPLRLAVIGAGRWGRIIISALEDTPGVHIARLGSRSADAHELVPADCLVSADWHDVASAPDLDGVILATPAALHAEMAITALRAGNAVLVEKPLALSVADAAAVVAAARQNDGIVHVDHVDLLNPGWQGLKDRLSLIGPLVSAEARFGAAGPFRADSPPRWDWGPHPVALCVDLLGPPSAVRARHDVARSVEAGFLEQVEIDLEFIGGVTARVTTGNAMATKQRRFTVRGQAGTLVYDDTGTDKLSHLAGDSSRPIAVESEPPLPRVLAAFGAAIARGEPDWSGAELGLTVVDVLARVDSLLETSSSGELAGSVASIPREARLYPPCQARP